MNAAVATTTAVQTARRPMPTDFKPIQQLTTGELMGDPRVFKAIAESSAKHLSPERMLRVMTQAMRKTPKLAQCNPLSLMGVMISCASLGLEPNTPLGHAYLIPFDKNKKVGSKWELDYVDVNLIIGYQGLIDLSRRTGSLVSIHADVVYEGDEFEFEYGSNMHIFHRPVGDSEGRKPLYAYAHSKLSDGEAFEVRPYASILRLRDSTQAFKKAMEDKAKGYRTWSTTPWVAYEEDMARKTMVRRLAKWLPKSIEFASAVAMDSLAERGMIDFQQIANQPALASNPEMAAIEEQSAEVVQDQPQQQTATTTVETAKKETPKPPAAKKAEPQQQISEQDEREADRMTRAAMEGQNNPAEATLDDGAQQADDGWDGYLEKMAGEVKAAATSGIAAEVNKTFRDSVVGAMGRNEITEARANALLIAWTKHYTPPAKSTGKK